MIIQKKKYGVHHLYHTLTINIVDTLEDSLKITKPGISDDEVDKEVYKNTYVNFERWHGNLKTWIEQPESLEHEEVLKGAIDKFWEFARIGDNEGKFLNPDELFPNPVEENKLLSIVKLFKDEDPNIKEKPTDNTDPTEKPNTSFMLNYNKLDEPQKTALRKKIHEIMNGSEEEEEA